MRFNDDLNDPKVFDDPKGFSIGSMGFDNPKVYGDTSITDGLVSITVVQGTINCASLLAGSRSKEEMGGIARARDKDIILKSIAFVCRGDPSASLLLTNARRQFLAPQVL